MSIPGVGIIGGTGLYQLEGLEQAQERSVETPFGATSDKIISGLFQDRVVHFLPRHGRGHRLLPTEVPHRANIWALRSLGARWIVSVAAVGSLKEVYRPRDLVLPDQFFDRTSRRSEHTFFGDGIAAHIAFGEPISVRLRQLIHDVARDLELPFHNGGTYVNMDGPAFSTRAESEANRQLGFDLIGMTNLPEAKLAREAEIAYATMAFVTDYDCWRAEDEPVTAQVILGHLSANVATAKRILAELIPKIPSTADWPEHSALDAALVTPKEFWPARTSQRLRPILARFLS